MIRFLILVLSLLSCACSHLGYFTQVGFDQMKLMGRRQSLERVLTDPKMDSQTKNKIKLVQEAKKYAEEKLSLKKTRNYETFVKLDERYVIYAVTASRQDRLEGYQWDFPIVGKVPYKGFFKKEQAESERRELEAVGLDVSQRGVSAYSTLGWFSDPLLSSMTAGGDDDLVETVIHESTHATIYIADHADFNERLATFVGQKGMEEFYVMKQGPGSPTVKRAREGLEDLKTFGHFISEKIKDMTRFYEAHRGSPRLLQEREIEFEKMKKEFVLTCQPKLLTGNYNGFPKLELNNAVLLGYKTYFHDLGLFEKAFKALNGDWRAFIDKMKSLSSAEDPEAELERFVASQALAQRLMFR